MRERRDSSSSNSSEVKVTIPPQQQTLPPSEQVEFRPFKRWRPGLVPLIVLANVGLFLATMFVNNCPKKSRKCFAKFLGRFSFQPLKENPILGPSSATLSKMGALDVNKVVDDHQVWRLFTTTWLHAGVAHVIANILSLVFIGVQLEQEFGFVRIGLLYLISGLGGNILSALFIESSISVGASGALFGLLGAMLSELITNWTIYANKLAALLTLILIILINLAVGLVPHVDNFAHVGGFISGFFLGFIFLIRPHFGYVNQEHRLECPGSVSSSAKPKYKTYQLVLWVLSLLLLISCFIAALITLFRGVNANDHCTWCRYLSCFPTAKHNCKSTQANCEAIQIEKRFNLACLNNGRSRFYTSTEENSSQIEQLCSQLCS